jgi:four helix bundle protein
MKIYFDHEKLLVYKKTINFIAWVSHILETIKTRTAAKDQIERASTSIALNLAEGNGKYSKKDRCRFWEIALGYAVECAACLDVLFAKKLITTAEVDEGKKQLYDIVNMLNGLIKREKSQASRFHEKTDSYLTNNQSSSQMFKEEEGEYSYNYDNYQDYDYENELER